MNLTIAWLYPDLMSTYGDRGNVITLQKRCEWRGIEAEVKKISVDSPIEDLESTDLIFMGGAQDTQQEIVNRDLFAGRGEEIKKLVNKNVPGLFICGAYQFMGNYYKTAEGKILKGLKLFDLYTVSSKLGEKRLIGNVIIKSKVKSQKSKVFVGFENHGGRTYLKDKSQAFALVEKGYGNNSEDATEGIIFKNAIGSYLHGPLLPKNPEIADWLISLALEVKYKKKIELKPLNDELELKAREEIIKKIIKH